MCFSYATYAQESKDSIAELRAELKRLNEPSQKLTNKLRERGNYLKKTRSPQLSDPEMKRLRRDHDSISMKKYAIKREIQDIRLNNLLKSERHQEVYRRILNANNRIHATDILINYVDSLDMEHLDSLFVKYPDFRDRYHSSSPPPAYPVSPTVLEAYPVFREVIYQNFKFEGGKERYPQFIEQSLERTRKSDM